MQLKQRTKKWLKRVSDTSTNMELDEELKFRVATRLMDKSVVTWWDNLKFCPIALVTWNYFVQEFNEQYYTHFHRNKKKGFNFISKQSSKKSRSLNSFGKSSRSSRSFISSSLAFHADREVSSLKHKLVVTTLLGE